MLGVCSQVARFCSFARKPLFPALLLCCVASISLRSAFAHADNRDWRDYQALPYSCTQSQAADLDVQQRSNALFDRARNLVTKPCSLSDLAAALILLDHAAQRGHVKATYLLSTLYGSGVEGISSHDLHIDYLERAARLGHVEAQFEWGLTLLLVSQTQTEADHALYWLGQAAWDGHAKSAALIALAHFSGLGGARLDPCLSADWSAIAKELGARVTEELSLVPC